MLLCIAALQQSHWRIEVFNDQGIMQCVAVRGSMLHRVAVYCSVLQHFKSRTGAYMFNDQGMMQCVGNSWQYVAECCSVLQCVAAL